MFGLSKSEKEAKAGRILDRVDALCRKEFPQLAATPLDDVECGKQQLEIKKIQLLYRHLDIIDTKTSVLLRFDGLLVTAFIFLIGFGRMKFLTFSLDSFLTHSGLLLAIVSAALCLTIVSITSRFLEYSDDLDSESKKLAMVVARRALYYRGAWFLSVVALVFIPLALLPALFG